MLGSAIAAAGIGLATAAGYQSMAPTGQWFGRTFTGLRSRSKQLGLTYDDGPNDPHTMRLIEVLAKHDVRATFFVIGRFARQRPNILREVAQQGHVIGNHTFNHPLLIFKSPVAVQNEMEECRHAIRDAVGEHSNLFRPPFGGRRPEVLRVARKLGMEPVMWNVTGYDWNAPPADRIQAKVVRQVTGGEVILLHDGGHEQLGADRSQTVLASDKIISRYKSEGYQFVTVPEMMSSLRGENQLP